MTTPTCTIGLDLGTTTIKAVAYALDRRVIAQASEAVTTHLSENGHAEQDPQHVYEQAVRVLATVTQAAGAQGYIVARIGLSAAMHSLIAIDAQSTPITPALLWMDARAQPQAAALWATPAGQALYRRTGTPIHALAPVAKLLWLRAEMPAIWQQSARFVSLKEWLWFRWFGVWEVDASIASATGLFNLATGDWDTEALALVNLTPQAFSALVPTTHTRQGVQEPRLLAAGLTAATSITIGASDGVLANLGAQAIGHEALVLTIGTSCAVRRGSAIPYTNPATRTFCYVLAQDRFIVGAASNSGGVVLDWLMQPIFHSGAAISAAQWAQLLDAASTITTDDLLCLPYVAGERAPIWDAAAGGSFIGLRLHHRPAHLLRAAIEGILFNAYWLASDVIDPSNPPHALITSGTVLAMPWVQQLAADIFGLPVQASAQSDASARGAALIAEIAARQATWPTAPPTIPPTALPTAPNRHAAQYARFREMCAKSGSYR